MDESGFWSYIEKGMKGRWDASRHEDLLGLGVPDVSFGCGGQNGWIELKYLPKFPKRPATPVKIRHYTNEQKIWLRKRGKAGGSTWLFLRIEKEFLLFHWTKCREVGKLPIGELREIARARWVNRIKWDELENILKSEK